MMSFALKMMGFVFNMMTFGRPDSLETIHQRAEAASAGGTIGGDFTLKMMELVVKMMNFTLKLMDM